MDMLHAMATLGDGSFGGGLGAGFGAGFAAGIGAGIAIGSGSGSSDATAKLKLRLGNAIEAGEICVLDREGAPMTVDSVLSLLQGNSPPA